MAFTGNKFEFRMPGSSQSISGPNIALNTIMAQELGEFADRLEKSEHFQSDLQKLLKEVFTEHERIIFNGNGYDDAWVKEAQSRGLLNLRTTADAMPYYACPKNIKLYTDNNIYTREELEARAQIHMETYNAVLEIEARTMIDMMIHDILPAASAYSAELCDRTAAKKALGLDAKYESALARSLSVTTDKLSDACNRLSKDMDRIPADVEKAMAYINKTIIPDMERARAYADELEAGTDSGYWPFPSYSELMFSE